MNPEVMNMDKEDLQNALEELSKRDYDIIQALTLELDRGVKAKRQRKSYFGYWMALELLAKLGIFMNGRT